ncbi:MAG: TIGR03086 family metal-binding protein [Acidimicrobiales bacterium]
MNLPAVHDQALRSTHAIVAAVKQDQWTDPTPCTEWDVRALINHIVAENFWVEPLVAGRTIDDVGDRYDGDVLGRDPVVTYDSSARAASHAFHRPGAMDAPVAVSYGPVPGRVFARHRILDVVIHGWDVAKATGQPTDIESDLLDACWRIVERERDDLQESGYFGEEVAVPDGADTQTKLLAILGRER